MIKIILDIKRFLPKAVLLLILLYLQQGSLVHAIEHPFHADDANISCSTFFAGEHLADVSLQSSNTPLIKISTLAVFDTLIPAILTGEKPHPRSRSPPITFL